jgi:hypothetical protein
MVRISAFLGGAPPAADRRSGRRLERLIGACIDDERTLRHESRFVGPGRRAELLRLAFERQQFADELRILSEGRRGGSRAGGSFWERLREFARSLRVVAGGPNSGDAIAACRRSGDRTEAHYARAIAWTWSEHVVPTLLAQRSRMREQHDELLAMQF